MENMDKIKCLCLHNCQVGGHVYDRGDVAELSRAQYEARRHSFRQLDGEAAAAPATPAPEPLTKAQIMQKLDELHVGYTQKATLPELQALLAAAHERG